MSPLPAQIEQPAPEEIGQRERIRVVVYQPRLCTGGAQRITLTVLRNLNRERFAPSLVLRKQEGEWLNRIPSDVPVYCLNRRVRSAWLKLGLLLRELSPNVVLSMSTMGNLTVCLAHLSGRIRVPLVVSEHNTLSQAWGSSRWRLRRVSLLKHLLYRRAVRVLAVSQGVADDLVKWARLPMNKLVVIYNPVVDEELIRRSDEAIEHPWFRDEIPIILAAARLTPQKDFPMLLESFKRLRRERVARLVILGDGELRNDLEDLARRLEIAQDVAFLGFVGNAPAYMKRCTVFALSSRYEGLPVALLEAMACGAPVVSTDCPSGPREIVSNGEDGLLVPVGDPQSMANAIKLLLDDAELRTSLSERGRARANHFSVDNAVSAYEELLDTLARPGRCSGRWNP